MRRIRYAHHPEALAETRSNFDLHDLRRDWQVPAMPRRGDPGSVGVRRRPQQVGRRRCLDIPSSLGREYAVVVGAWRRCPASLHQDNPTAVCVGDIVETKKLPRTPTNQCAPDIIDHGLDLDVARRERRGNKTEESIAYSLGLEVSGGPRDKFGRGAGPDLTHVHGDSLSDGGYYSA